MPPSSNHRLEILEQQVESLSTLPARVTSLETQILQFLEETRAEFVAVRGEMREGFELLRAELRGEMRDGDERTRREMHELHADTLRRFDLLREEMRAGDEETRRHARVLHEEVLARFVLLDERWNGSPQQPCQAKPRGMRRKQR